MGGQELLACCAAQRCSCKLLQAVCCNVTRSQKSWCWQAAGPSDSLPVFARMVFVTRCFLHCNLGLAGRERGSSGCGVKGRVLFNSARLVQGLAGHQRLWDFSVSRCSLCSDVAGLKHCQYCLLPCVRYAWETADLPSRACARYMHLLVGTGTATHF
jgi:hypothetical protein